MSVALRIIVLLISFACVAGGALFISCTFSRVRLDPKKYNDDAVILAAFGDKKETIRSYSVFYYTQFHIFPGDILASIGHPSYEHQTFFVGKHKRMMRAVQAMGVLGLFFAFWGMVLAAVYTVVGCMGGGGGSSDESAPRTPYGDDHDTTTAPTEDMSEVEVDPSNPPPQREQNDEEEPKEDLDTQEEKKKDKKQKKSGGAAPACTALAIVMLLLFILAFIMYIPAFVMMVILIEKPGKTALQSYTWADYGFALVSPTLEAHEVTKRNYSVGFIMMIVAMGSALVLIILSLVLACCCKSGGDKNDNNEEKAASEKKSSSSDKKSSSEKADEYPEEEPKADE